MTLIFHLWFHHYAAMILIKLTSYSGDHLCHILFSGFTWDDAFQLLIQVHPVTISAKLYLTTKKPGIFCSFQTQ